VRDCKNSPNQKFIEYYDLRDCESAFNANQATDFMGGSLDIKYAFLQSKKDMTAPPARGGAALPRAPPAPSPRDEYRGTSRPPLQSSSRPDPRISVQPFDQYSNPSGPYVGATPPVYNPSYPSYGTQSSQLNLYPSASGYSSGNYNTVANGYSTNPLSSQNYSQSSDPRTDPNKVVLEQMSQYTQSLAQSASSNQSSYHPSQSSYQYPSLSMSVPTTSQVPAISNSTIPQSQAQLQQLVNMLLQQQQHQGSSQSYQNYRQ